MHRTVEWNPNLLAIHSQINATHFVIPDLSRVYSEIDKQDFIHAIPISQRIQTISACNHDEKSLNELSIQANKVLVVGGHDKNSCQQKEKGLNKVQNNETTKTRLCCSLTALEATEILHQRNDTHFDIWGVTNPNHENSISRVEEKIAAGMTGFITQPLLSSHALDILESYPKDNATFIAGIAMPASNKSLQFWLQLLEQPELETDALFKSHMAYFQSPYFTSMAWIQREIQILEAHATIDGIHFMPMKNTKDLLDLLKK
jgi:hypothetical protein